MKVKFFSMLATIVACALAFASCSKTKTAEEVAGSYNGTQHITVNGSQVINDQSAVVHIVETDDDKVTIFLPSLKYNSFEIATMTIENIRVSEKDDDDYILENKTFSQTVAGVNIAGNISGTVKNNLLSITYSLTPGSMPMTIDCTFVGFKQD